MFPFTTPHDRAAPKVRTMTETEIDDFLSTGGFGILSLAEGNHAYGVPLFYGARGGDLYFQTRPGAKSHYLYATTEACLSVSGPRGLGEWASVQLLGRLERVDGRAAGSAAESGLSGIPPPFPWAEDDARGHEPRGEGVTTFRLVPTRRIGRYSEPPAQAEEERGIGF